MSTLSTSFPLYPQGSALGTMVGLLTYGSKKYESLDSLMRVTIEPLYQATQNMLPLIDKDTLAFNDYMVQCILCVIIIISDLIKLHDSWYDY